MGVEITKVQPALPSSDLLPIALNQNFNRHTLFTHLPPHERALAIAQVSQTDLLRHCLETGEKIPRTENIRVGDIIADGFIIDDRHALALGHAMEGEWGMTQPVMVRARLTEASEVVFDPLDGYHRIEGRKKVNEKGEDADIHAVVLYGCTDAQMIDQRILAANSVQSVQFARRCLWMNEAWKITPWANIMTIAQAFNLASNKSTGRNLVGDDEVAKEIVLWVDEKCSQWLTTPGTIFPQLKTFENADMAVALKVRSGGTFRKGQLALTPGQLGLIVAEFPHAQYPGVQLEIARFATSHGLGNDKITELLTDIKALPVTDGVALHDLFSSEKWRTRAAERTRRGRKERGEANAATIQKQLTTLTDTIIDSNVSQALKIQLLQVAEHLLNLLKHDRLDPSEKSLGRANEFIERWSVNTRMRALNKDATVQTMFSAELRLLDAGALYQVLQYFADRLFSQSIDEQDTAVTAFSLMPISEFRPELTTGILQVICENLKNLHLSREAVDVSPVLENLMLFLGANNTLILSIPHAWQNTMQAIYNASNFAEPICRDAVFIWCEHQSRRVSAYIQAVQA